MVANGIVKTFGGQKNLSKKKGIFYLKKKNAKYFISVKEIKFRVGFCEIQLHLYKSKQE